MDASELWKRYRQYFCHVDSLDLSLDISRMHFDDAFLASMEPRCRTRSQAWTRSNPAPSRIPTKSAWWAITGCARRNSRRRKKLRGKSRRPSNPFKKFAADVHAGKIRPPMAARFTQVLAIGIGGSALGPMFVGDALGDPASDRMRIHFIDNTDPDGIARTLETLERTALRDACAS